jgi:chromosome segregation ATPase
MADSVTYEEFVKQENKRSGKDDASPTDTETTAIEDLQSTISEVQDNIKNLTHKTKQDQIYHQWEHQQLKATFTEYQEMTKEKVEGYQEMMKEKLEGYQTVMNHQLNTCATRIQELESQVQKPSTDSDSSVWEINSSSSDSEP